MTRREALLLVALAFTIGMLVGRGPAGVLASLLRSIPDKQGLIHGCYNTKSGGLRVIDPSSAKCARTEKGLVWHQNWPTPAPTARPIPIPSPIPTSANREARVSKTITIPAGFTCPGGQSSCVVDTLAVPGRLVTMDFMYQIEGEWYIGDDVIAYEDATGGRDLFLGYYNGSLELIYNSSKAPANAIPVKFQAVYQPSTSSGVAPRRQGAGVGVRR